MNVMMLIAAVSSVAIYLAYRPLCAYVRLHRVSLAQGQETQRGKKDGNRNSKKNEESVVVPETGISSIAEKKGGRSVFFVMMAVGLAIRLIGAIAYRGYEADINCFLSWASMVFENGIGNFYSLDAFTDYPPGYMYVLYVIGAIRSVFQIDPGSTLSVVITKMPAILCDLAIAFLIYKIACRQFKETGAAILSGIYLATPAIVLDSAIWAQVDSVFTLCIVLMCYLITERKLIPAYFVFAIGILIKPQSLFFTPVLILGIIDQIFIESYAKDERAVFYKKFWMNLGCGILAILMIGLLMLPFGFQNALAQYTETLGSYPYASVNAYNFWTMIGKNWSSQTDRLFGVSFQAWGTVAIIAGVLFTGYIHLKNKDSRSKYYFSAALLLALVFTFSVRMHERYLYPAIVLLILCFAERPRKKLFMAYIYIALAAFCNMIHVMLYYDANNFDRVNAFPIYVGAGTVAAAVYLIYTAFALNNSFTSETDESLAIAEEVGQARVKREKGRNIIQVSEPLAKMEQRDWICMAAITLVYAVVAFSNLGNKEGPETDYSLTDKGEIVLDFGQPVEIAQIWDFLGYQNNPKYVVYCTNDMQAGWTPVFTEEEPWDTGSVFCWNGVDTSISGQYVWISALSQDSMIELVFLDSEGNRLLPVNASAYPELFDEQEFFIGRGTYQNGTYFDEIYHARTAYEMIHHLYCYENTHPPLGKIFIAIGVLIFGMNPFGWRFMGVLFGVLMLPVFYLFCKKLFKETWLACVTTVLFAFDFMHYAQTRIATIDVFVTFFIILMYYFMYCYTRKSFYDSSLKETFVPLGLCGVVMGLSWASKWTGIYASVGLCVIFFLTMGQRFREYLYAKKHPEEETGNISHSFIIQNFRKKFFQTIGFCLIFFVVVPAVIYTLSYIPMSDGTDSGLVERMINNQQSMFNYHSTLKATHPYSSTWYEWPIMKRPIFYYSGETPEGLKEGISAFGNPLVWWVGILAFLMVLYLAVMQKDRKCRYLTLGYFSQYLPWILIGRVVFIYHYFPSVPFLALMIGYCMKVITDKKPKWKPAMFVYAGLAVVLFILFYPVLTGTPVDAEYVSHYLRWYDSWVLVLE